MNNFIFENIFLKNLYIVTSLKSLSLFVKDSIVKSLKKKTWKNFPYKIFQSQFGKKQHIQNFETFFKINLWIWSICISIDVSFVPELKYGFKCHFGQIVLSQFPIMCIFWTIYDIYYEIVRKIHIIGHWERTICPKWHLKPYLSSGTKDTSIEIHIDHIHRLFLKNVSKFYICQFFVKLALKCLVWEFFSCISF